MEWKIDARQLWDRGPLIDVELYHPRDKQVRRGKALLDTGGDQTMISRTIAEELKLEEKPSRKSRGVNDTQPRETKIAVVTIRMPELDLNVLDLDVLVAQHGAGDDVICIIGRDILYACKLTLSFDGPEGTYSLSGKLVD